MLTHEEYTAEVAAEREKRLALLRAMRAKLADALRQFNPKKARLNDIVAGVRMVSDQLRLEFRAQPPTEEKQDPPAVESPPDDPLNGLRLFRSAG